MTQSLITVSICGLCAAGVVAFIPNRRLSIISRADQALYIAKQGGRNRVAVYTSTSGSNDA